MIIDKIVYFILLTYTGSVITTLLWYDIIVKYDVMLYIWAFILWFWTTLSAIITLRMGTK